jgi:hypothetical protein
MVGSCIAGQTFIMTRRKKTQSAQRSEPDSAHEMRVMGGGDRPLMRPQSPPHDHKQSEDLGETSDEYLPKEPPYREEMFDMTAGQDEAFVNPDIETAPGQARVYGGFGADTERVDQSETAEE